MVRHVIYWLAIMIALVFYFAYESEWQYAIYFVSFLTPIALGTTYLFNYHLVPEYLLKGKLFKFGLYFIYTLIISFYLEMVVMILSLVALANFQIEGMSPRSGNIVHLSIIIYLIVFVTAFLKLIKQMQEHNLSIKSLKADNNKLQKAFINIRVDRKDYNLSLDETVYIESLADFVKIHLIDQSIVSKQKISVLNELLPSHFIRLHRSFIVNRNFVSAFNKEKVEIAKLKKALPISRTYKKDALEKLSSHAVSL
jgi:two-component system response regulator LytT